MALLLNSDLNIKVDPLRKYFNKIVKYVVNIVYLLHIWAFLKRARKQFVTVACFLNSNDKNWKVCKAITQKEGPKKFLPAPKVMSFFKAAR